MRRVFAYLGLALFAFATVQVFVVRDRILGLEVSEADLASLKQRLERLPERFGEGAFEPFPFEVNEEMVRQSGADTYATRGYRDPEGAVYRVYIGGAIRNRESFHAPNYCMPAAGWEILDQQSVESPMQSDGSRIRRLHARRGNDRMLVYYWFQCGSRQTDHDLVARWFRFLDFVTGAGDDALQPTMIVQIYVPFEGSSESAMKRSREFMRSIGPALVQAVLNPEISP